MKHFPHFVSPFVTRNRTRLSYSTLDPYSFLNYAMSAKPATSSKPAMSAMSSKPAMSAVFAMLLGVLMLIPSMDSGSQLHGATMLDSSSHTHLSKTQQLQMAQPRTVLQAEPFTRSGQELQEWPEKLSQDLRSMPFDVSSGAMQALFQKTEGKLTFTFFEERFDVDVTQVIRHLNGTTSIVGDVNGMPMVDFVLSVTDGRMYGKISNPVAAKAYEIRYSPSLQTNLFIETDPSLADFKQPGEPLIPEEHGYFAPERGDAGSEGGAGSEGDAGNSGQESSLGSADFKRSAGLAGSAGSAGLAGSAALSSDKEEMTQIDVMIVYTSNARNWGNTFAGGIDNVLAQSLATAAAVVENSNITIEYRLVHSQLIDYQETGSAGTDLDRFTSTNDGFMDEIHDLRDEYGADLLSLYAASGDAGGLAWLLTSTNGFPSLGFSWALVQQAGGTTYIHEVGHNMGNNHSRNQQGQPAGPGGGLFTYSTGWRWTGTNNVSYASVMTYGEGSIEAQIFSNPDVEWQGVPSGSYTGQYAPADNSRSMMEIKEVVAGYRPNMINEAIIGISRDEYTWYANAGTPVEDALTISNSGDEDLILTITDFEPDPAVSGGVAGTGSAAGAETPSEALRDLRSRVHAAPNASARSIGTLPSLPEFSRQDNERVLLSSATLTSLDEDFTDPSDWVTVDADGDDSVWSMVSSFSGTSGTINPRQGANMAISFSWNEGALTPDNWLISPEMEIKAGDQLKFWLNSDDNFPAEKISVYMGTGTQPEDFDVVIFEKTLTAGNWDEYTAEMGFYAGQTARVAFRHHDSSDQYFVVLDHVRQVANDPFEAWIQYEPTQAVVAPGESRDIVLTAITEGLETGTYTRTLRIESNDNDNPVIDISLTLEIIDGELGEVVTVAVTDTTAYTATVSGEVISAGSGTVTDRGVCVSVTQNPSLSDECVSSGSGTGSFSAEVTGLVPFTTYYVRSYVSTTVGVSYGSQLSFVTLPLIPEISVSQETFSWTLTQGATASDELVVSNLGNTELFFAIVDRVSGTYLSRDDGFPRDEGLTQDDITISGSSGTASGTASGTISGTVSGTDVAVDVSHTAPRQRVDPDQMFSRFPNSFIDGSLYPIGDASTLDITDELEEDFTNADNWTLYDADEDGNNWEILEPSDIENGAQPIEGTRFAGSFSWNINALTPDNWLVSPRMIISDGDQLAFWVNSDSGFPTEKISVYISQDASSPESFTEQIFTRRLTVGPWREYVVDLSPYAVSSAYVAFRHHDTTNQYYLLLDHVRQISGQDQDSWLAFTPDQGTIDAESSQTIGITASATDLQPGTYERIIRISSSDPSDPELFLPMTLTVEPGDNQTDITQDYREGWNLVSQPVMSEDSDGYDFFPTAFQNTLFEFNGSYVQADTMNAGTGYWINLSEPSQATFSGGALASAPVMLREGWNMIGSLSAQAEISDPDDVVFRNTLYEFDGSYELATSLEPGNGYWVAAREAGDVTLTPQDQGDGSASMAMAPLQIPDEASRITITERQGQGPARTLFFNADLPETMHRMQRSLPPPPPGNTFDVRFDGGFWAISEPAGLVRLQPAPGSEPLTLLVDGHSAVRVTMLREGMEIQSRGLMPGESVTLAAGTDALMVSVIDPAGELPEQVELAQNYPNPFNPSTEIRFALPGQAMVQLDVFDMAGRRVAVLASETMEAGWHAHTFDASALASGVYIYQLRTVPTGEGSAAAVTRKMVMLK